MITVTRNKLKLISRFEIAFVFGLFSPIVIIISILKIKKINYFGSVEKFTTAYIPFYSDIGFYALTFFSCLLILLWVRKYWKKALLLIFYQCIFAIVALLEISSHNYYMKSGSPLDYQLLYYTLSNFKELQDVLASESDNKATSILVLTFLVSFIVPWLIVHSVEIYYKLTATVKHEKLLQFEEEQLIFSFFSSDLKESSFVGRRFLIPLTIFFLLSIVSSIIFITRISYEGKNKFLIQNSIMTIVDTAFDKIYSNSNLVLNNWKPPVKTYLTEKKSMTSKVNLVLIIMETTRADSTSIYLNKYNTTPFLKKFATQSVNAKFAHSVLPRTSKSLVAIHCGIEPRPSMEIIEANKNKLPAKCLPKLLKEKGYDTVYFQTAWKFFENRENLIKNIGHAEFYPGDSHPSAGFEKTNYFGYEDRIVLGPSYNWHKKRKSWKNPRPFMVSYLTNTTHHDYGVPSSVTMRNYVNNPMHNQYLNTLRYVDGFIKDLIKQYKKLKIYKNTLFVIIGDHGEGFWEHNFFGHSNIVYEEGLWVPLLIHYPKKLKPKIISRPVSQIDLLPTIVSILNYRIEGGTYRGYNILSPRKNYQTHSACWQENTCASTLFSNSIKYIHYFKKKPDEVYNLIKDPLEKKNIIAQFPKKVKFWNKELLSWYHHLEAMYDDDNYNKN